jgi:Domain of unknown function (DUF1854).
MTSESVRFRRRNIHQHDDETGLSGPCAGPSSPDDSCGSPASAASDHGGRLWREGDKVLYRSGDGEAAAVRILWAQPLSGRGGPVSIMAADKKKEIAYLPRLDVLPEESRRIAAEELAANMILARITAIHSVRPRFGNYYWDVDTDRGRRVFLLTSPENNSMRPTPDSLVVRDAFGNCYEINPVSKLDPNSLRELDRVL